MKTIVTVIVVLVIALSVHEWLVFAGKISQRVLSWEEAVTEFNLSRIAIYGQKTTLSCGTTLTFVKDQI